MLRILILLILSLPVFAKDSPARERSKQMLNAGCLRSEVDGDPDKRRRICDCITRNLAQNLSDDRLEYLAKTWAEPQKQHKPPNPEFDILEDYDEEIMELCRSNTDYKAAPKPSLRQNPRPPPAHTDQTGQAVREKAEK